MQHAIVRETRGRPRCENADTELPRQLTPCRVAFRCEAAYLYARMSQRYVEWEKDGINGINRSRFDSRFREEITIKTPPFSPRRAAR